MFTKDELAEAAEPKRHLQTQREIERLRETPLFMDFGLVGTTPSQCVGRSRLESEV